MDDVTDTMSTAALAERVPGTDYFVRDFIPPPAAPVTRRAVIQAAIAAAIAAAREPSDG